MIFMARMIYVKHHEKQLSIEGAFNLRLLKGLGLLLKAKLG